MTAPAARPVQCQEGSAAVRVGRSTYALMSGVTPANRMLPTREDVVGALFERRVAFAGGLFESRAIHDLNMPAAVADHLCALQQPCRNRHRGAAHAEHLRETFLRQRDAVATDAITGLQQPTTKPRLDRMQRNARHRLLDLHDQQIVAAKRELADSFALPCRGPKLRGRKTAGCAVELNDCPADGNDLRQARRWRR
jgi:hypothetical protein